VEPPALLKIDHVRNEDVLRSAGLAERELFKNIKNTKQQVTGVKKREGGKKNKKFYYVPTLLLTILAVGLRF